GLWLIADVGRPDLPDVDGADAGGSPGDGPPLGVSEPAGAGVPPSDLERRGSGGRRPVGWLRDGAEAFAGTIREVPDDVRATVFLKDDDPAVILTRVWRPRPGCAGADPSGVPVVMPEEMPAPV